MGRVSKYATHEERQLAAEERRKTYSQSKRAKLLRCEQNRRAYQRRTGATNKSKLEPTWPTIPREVRQLGLLPLPKQSHFFKKEFRLREEVSDEDELAKWDYYPPYRIRHGSISDGGLGLISDYVHGRRLREQFQFEGRRMERYNNSTDDQILTEINRDIHTYLTSWNDLKTALQALPATPAIDHIMGKHLLQWKARRIVDLVEDWKLVKKGRGNDRFSLHYMEKWSQY